MGEPPQAEFAAALEQFVNGKVALENEVAAILDLGDGIEARQVELLALLGGEEPFARLPVYFDPRSAKIRA
jgi:hypothetical protein